LAEHTADHLAFYRRGRCANPDNGDDWLAISPHNFDAPEMHCKVLVARARRLSRKVLVRRRSDSKLLVLAIQRPTLRIADRPRAMTMFIREPHDGKSSLPSARAQESRSYFGQ
jgi:hypothetical protein